MTTRYFEYAGDGECPGSTPSKFWEVSVAGDAVTIRYGRVGAAGQTRTTTHSSVGEAMASALQSVAAKRKQGYVERDTGDVRPESGSTKASGMAPLPAGNAARPVELTFPLLGGRDIESVEGTAVDVTGSGSGVYRVDGIPLGVGVGRGDLVQVKVARGSSELNVVDVLERSPRFTLSLAVADPAGGLLSTSAATAWSKAIARQAKAGGAFTRSTASRTAVCCPGSAADGVAALAWVELVSAAAFEELTPRQQAQLSKGGAFADWAFSSVPSYGPGRPPGLACRKSEPLFAQAGVSLNRLWCLHAKGGGLVAAGDRDGALAAWAVQAQQGAPSSLASFMWTCMEAGEFDRALMLATWSIDACLDFAETCVVRPVRQGHRRWMNGPARNPRVAEWLFCTT